MQALGGLRGRGEGLHADRRVKADLRLSKAASQPARLFIETQTAGDRSQLLSSTTKAKLIAWPLPDKQEGDAVRRGSISIPALVPTLTADTDPVSGASRRHGTGSRGKPPPVLTLFSVSCVVTAEWILNATVL